MRQIGIDISDWQYNVNYDKVAQAVTFAILRVGYGVSYMPEDQKDSELDNHYNGLKGKIPLGAYYYAYGVDYETGRKEAENCLAYMGNKQFEMPIFYDMEENRNTKEAGQGFVDRIREAGLKAGIYASSSFYDNKRLYEINCDSVWIAEYDRNNGEIPYEKPSTPCNIWQYTSKGYVEGIDGVVDMNILLDDNPLPNPIPSQGTHHNGDEQIREIQNWLNNNYGTGIAEDGYYGSETKGALVKALQTEFNRQFGENLDVDGIFGFFTKQACQEIAEGAEGNITHIIQAMLYCLGYNTNGVDGIFGNGTDSAVRQFQADNGLSVDGIVGRKTFAKLFE